MKRADAERFKLLTGLSRHVLYCLLAVRCLRGGGAIYLTSFMKAK
jgi:hypothetical protein